ncbi:methyltransferase [Streptomyces triticagri]|nr:methyltransferase [Streptomyces triticagri]
MTDTLPGIDPADPPDPAQLPPPVGMLLLVTAKWISQAVHVAAELGIADLVSDGPQTVDDLAAKAGCRTQPLHRVLRAIASYGVFAELPDGRIVNTPMSDYLRTDVPGSVRHMARMEGADFTWRPYGKLLHTVRTGEPAFDHVFGQRIFDHLAEHPREEEIFNRAMTSFTEQSADAIVADHDFSRHPVITDLGGGQGHLLAAILRANPEVRGVLLDRAPVVESAQRAPVGPEVRARMSYVAGDFFGPIPPEAHADAYVLRTCLHDWSDDECVAILRNVRTAMGDRTDARLLIMESVVQPGNAFDVGKLIDLEMLTLTTGLERTEAQWAHVLERAGFAVAAITETEPPLSVIEARPASAHTPTAVPTAVQTPTDGGTS